VRARLEAAPYASTLYFATLYAFITDAYTAPSLKYADLTIGVEGNSRGYDRTGDGGSHCYVATRESDVNTTYDPDIQNTQS
jgi:hypothetical protein